MADLVVDNLIVNGELLANENIVLNRSNRALVQRDSRGKIQNLAHLDDNDGYVVGPTDDKNFKRYGYVPEKSELVRMDWQGWYGMPSPGLVFSPLGVGSPYSVDYPGTSLMQFTTGANSGDGVLLDFNGKYATTAQRTMLMTILTFSSNNYADFGFGFRASPDPNSPAAFMRYASYGSGGTWSFTTRDGNGGVSDTQLPSPHDMSSLVQVRIDWPNSFDGGPAPITFSVSNANNEVVPELQSTHVYAMNSIPPKTAKLRMFAYGRNNGGEEITYGVGVTEYLGERGG